METVLQDFARPEINQALLIKRYAQGEEKTWEDVAWRVARHAGQKNGHAQAFFDAIYAGHFFPSRMTYMGTTYPFASSCFVFPVEDSLTGIMQTLADACQVQKYGGGTGYNFSHLRPKGSLIHTSGGDASGPVSFMGLFHNAMEVVHRAGKKHAAQMGILNCDHPDIFDFIQCKDREGAYWTFNISVAVTDAFMQAVQDDTDWSLQFEGQIYRTLRARDLWDYIIQHAWHNGDPGIIFIDTVNARNRYPEPVEACNPCGEQMLPPYVSCNLGSLDLSRFVRNGEIDWVGLENATRIGVQFLDGSVDAAFWPVAKIQEKTNRYKNIGLGVMGWADMLILLNIPYASQAAVDLGKKVMAFIDATADDESKRLGGGVRKNTTVTSIAPTGSISLLAGCSSGIEPLFGIVTTKNTYVGSFHNVHWIFEQMAKAQGFYSEDLLAEIARSGSVQHLPTVPEAVKALFKTTMEIDWEWHVAHQAAFQQYTDNAVSKTINLPNAATVEDVGKAYLSAYQTGCKSITVYRDGSRQVQVMDTKAQQRDMCPHCNAILFMRDGKKACVTCGYEPPNEDQKPQTAETSPDDSNAQALSAERKRPARLTGVTYRQPTPLGAAYLTINQDEQGGPFEVFLNVGKAGSEISAISEALGRLISLTLRMRPSLSPADKLDRVADELIGIGGNRPYGFGPNRVLSLADGIGQALRLYTLEKTATLPKQETFIEFHTLAEQPSPFAAADLCPECGEATLLNVEGCRKCQSCGYSEC
jgi:ribonucleoside-diphosphate reductase alpha chain